MAFVEIAPNDRAALDRHGLAAVEHYLNWPGVVVSGHPSRHVLRVHAGSASFILKKEHRVPWRDRVASAWAGFGWSSKSVREARVLTQLRGAGIPCPEVVAAGEDGTQAFVLLREQTGMVELRECLARPHANRRALAHALGHELARIHRAGFTQPDLYAKHILVEPTPVGWRFCLLDWQRSRQQRTVTWRRRVHDLAALDASLAEHLAPVRLRLACLAAYRRAVGAATDLPLRKLAAAIRRVAERRLLRRKTRELRQPPLPDGKQHLLWLDTDERLCVARDFFAELGGQLPSWLPQDPQPRPEGTYIAHRLILLGSGRTGHLIERWRGAAVGWRRGKFPAPEFARAATIFRLQRFGVAGPRLLAMGHRPLGAQRFSFLLTEPPLGPTLESALRTYAPAPLRQHLLHRFGMLLRQMHEAGYTFPSIADPLQAWVVVNRPPSELALASVELLEKTRAPWQRLARADLQPILTAPRRGLSRADRLRILLGYLQLRRLDADTRRVLEPFRPRERRVA